MARNDIILYRTRQSNGISFKILIYVSTWRFVTIRYIIPTSHHILLPYCTVVVIIAESVSCTKMSSARISIFIVTRGPRREKETFHYFGDYSKLKFSLPFSGGESPIKFRSLRKLYVQKTSRPSRDSLNKKKKTA